MSITALALSSLLQSCAPNIGPRTMTAIVNVESGANPFAVRDNTLDRAYYPKSRDEAVRLASYLLSRRHNLDLGISQVNSANLPGLGMSVSDAFDPCVNLHGGASILAGDYKQAVSRFGPGQYALRRAIGAYNTGSLYAGNHYISMILAAAGIRDGAPEPVRVPNLASQPQENQESVGSSQASASGIPADATSAQIMLGTTAAVRPEDAPILVHIRKQGEAAFGASGVSNSGSSVGLTHIPVNRGTLTRIPVATANAAAPANNGGLTHIPVNTLPVDHLPVAGSQDPLPGEVIGPDGVPMMQQPGTVMPGEEGTASAPGDPAAGQQRVLHTAARRRR